MRAGFQVAESGDGNGEVVFAGTSGECSGGRPWCWLLVGLWETMMVSNLLFWRAVCCHAHLPPAGLPSNSRVIF